MPPEFQYFAQEVILYEYEMISAHTSRIFSPWYLLYPVFATVFVYCANGA